MPEVAKSESSCSSSSMSNIGVGSTAAQQVNQNQQTTTNTTAAASSSSNQNDVKSSTATTENQLEKLYATRLPWGVIRDKFSHMHHHSHHHHHQQQTSSNSAGLSLNLSDSGLGDKFANIEKKKPGEYLMHLLVLNFIQLGSKKLEQIVSGDKRVFKKKLNTLNHLLKFSLN